jgi:hypothetical protein
MKPELDRIDILSSYHSYVHLAIERDLPITVLTEEQLKELTNEDISKIVRRMRDMLRTPPTR